MEDQDLREIGISDAQHRRKLLQAARSLPKVTARAGIISLMLSALRAGRNVAPVHGDLVDVCHPTNPVGSQSRPGKWQSCRDSGPFALTRSFCGSSLVPPAWCVTRATLVISPDSLKPRPTCPNLRRPGRSEQKQYHLLWGPGVGRPEPPPLNHAGVEPHILLCPFHLPRTQEEAISLAHTIFLSLQARDPSEPRVEAFCRPSSPSCLTYKTIFSTSGGPISQSSDRKGCARGGTWCAKGPFSLGPSVPRSSSCEA
jgi:hypothetical protein